MSTPMTVLLGAALDAARSALRVLDADQIPNDLRKAAGYSGSLPPPLAKSLLRGLESYEWLRSKACEQLPDGDESDRVVAARFYLERPKGWELELAERAAKASAASASGSARSAAGKERDLEAALKASKAKMKAIQRDRRETVAALERRLAEFTGQRKAEAAGEARDERESMRAVQAIEQDLDRHRADADAARQEARDARQALHAERSLRRQAEASAAGAGETASWADDPMGLAERLDETALMARPAARASASDGLAQAAERLRLPQGLLPDTREAIDWLVNLGVPATVIVDGYNVGYLMQGERVPGPARSRVAPLLLHLHKMARGTLKVMVVYDSNLGPAETPLAPGPVALRYSQAGETADDEIVRLAGRLEGSVVVISNDRAVRDRSDAKGALPLWSEALLAWAGSR